MEHSKGKARVWHTLAKADSPPDYTFRTYRLSEEIVARLNQVAEEHRVGLSDLVRYLLTAALNQMDAGQLALPTRPARLLVIDYDRLKRE